MGVIGRLDDQVNEIIIKPVGERHGAAAEAEEPPPVSQTPASRPLPASEERDEGKAETDSSELPVWLL